MTRVRLVMNGRMHMDFLRVLDNILYCDVNSANYQYYGPKHGKCPADYAKLRLHRKRYGW